CQDHHDRELTRRPLPVRYNLGQAALVRCTVGREGKMRVTAAVLTASLAAAATPAATAARADDAEVERIVRQHVQPMLIAAGGMAVAGPLAGRAPFFNSGLAPMRGQGPRPSGMP